MNASLNEALWIYINPYEPTLILRSMALGICRNLACPGPRLHATRLHGSETGPPGLPYFDGATTLR